MSQSWFSNNPDKAWVEKFFILYTPFWISLMALMMVTGWVDSWSNGALLLHAMVVALPIFFLPLLMHKRYSTRSWQQSYFLKANVYLLVFGFWGNYAGSEYFFDLLGMVYNFPNASSTLDAALVGSGEQTVPVIMYFYTHAFFMTYHVLANVCLRKLALLHKTQHALLNGLLFIVGVFMIGYCLAWAETKTMANPLMAGIFYYEKMALMLTYGSMIYATYFIASFPIYYFIDEEINKPWSLREVVGAALAASTLTFYMLDIAVHIIGQL